MPQQHEAPRGLVPHLVVDGAAAAIDFYKKAFGAEELMRMPHDDGKRLMQVTRDGTLRVWDLSRAASSCGASSLQPRSVMTSVWCSPPRRSSRSVRRDTHNASLPIRLMLAA